MSAEPQEDRDTERWLRRQGLPYFVKPSARASRLTARVAPILVVIVVVNLLVGLLDDVIISRDFEEMSIYDVFFALFLLLVLIVVTLAPVIAGLITAVVLRRFPAAGTTVGLVALGLLVIVTPVLFTLVGFDPATGFPSLLADILTNALVAAAAYLLTWLGIGSFLSWAARAALRQLSAVGQLLTRALPLLMLVVLLAFFAKALWDVTTTMNEQRLIGVALFFVVLGALFIVPVIRTEAKRIDGGLTLEERDDLIATTGLVGLGGRPNVEAPPLNRLERLNLTTVMVLAQGFQVLIFAVLVFCFLVILGELAFSPEVLTSWLGEQPRVVSVLGFPIAMHVGLLKTAVFLSCVSSLNFLISVSTAPAYKTAFYDPLIAGARVALAVRSAYRATPATVGPADAARSDEGDRSPAPEAPGAGQKR